MRCLPPLPAPGHKHRVMRSFGSSPDRVVQLPGHGLLPPSPEPLPPPDIQLEERVRVVPPCPPWQPRDAIETGAWRRNPSAFPFDGRYWVFRERRGKHPTDALFAWKNDPGAGQPAYGSGGGVDRIPDPALFEFKPRKRKGGLPDLWEGYGLFHVSTRLLDILLEWDADALAHRRIVMREPGGEVFDEDHHFLDVVRNIPAIDYANSIVHYQGAEIYQGERYPPRPAHHSSVRLLDDIDPSFHLFRPARSIWGGLSAIVSDALKRRLEKVKPALRHIEFSPLFAGL